MRAERAAGVRRRFGVRVPAGAVRHRAALSGIAGARRGPAVPRREARRVRRERDAAAVRGGSIDGGHASSREHHRRSTAPDARKRILLGAHYDTRPRADRDPDPANRAKPIIGANDGASGVAVLLEIARLLGASKPSVGVDIVFFDGEDYGEEGNTEDYLLGSRRFATSLGGDRPIAVIVVDMVGERDSRIPVEGFSAAASPALCARGSTGSPRTLGVSNFVRVAGPVDHRRPSSLHPGRAPRDRSHRLRLSATGTRCRHARQVLARESRRRRKRARPVPLGRAVGQYFSCFLPLFPLAIEQCVGLGMPHFCFIARARRPYGAR